MSDYVMFGHSHFLFDLVEIIQANRGRLKTIVLNEKIVDRPGFPRLEDRIARLPKVGMVSIDEWMPSLAHSISIPGEAYVLGFGGIKAQPLTDRLYRDGIRFHALVHPGALVSPSAYISEGSIVNVGVIVGPGTHVGVFCQVNRGVTIGHDVILEEHVVVGPGANICGYVHVHRGARVCAGATVIDSVTIGEGAVVAAGAAVISDVAPHTMVAGVPAVVKGGVKP